MKFSEFRAKKQPQQVQETTLDEYQRERTERWDHHANVTPQTKEKIDSAMGNRDFTHFPLAAHHEETHDPDVIEHLINHGYEISDYKKGIVSKHVTVGDPERGIPHRVKRVEEKIGSVLNKTNAPDHIKKSYVNDPSRTLKTGGLELGHHIVVSTHPAAIGGMSTGTPWRSCMNMDDGINRHYLKHESENGTHIAFLVRHDDPTAFKTGLPTHPISRIALKALHNDDGESDTVYRPEHSHYGARTDGFHMAVNNWSEKNYPAKSGETYNKADESYNDYGISKYRAVTKVDVLNKIDSGKTSHNDREALQVVPHEIATEATHMVANKLKSVKDQQSFNSARDSLETLTSVKTLSPSHVAILRHAIKTAQSHDPSYNLSHGLAVTHGDKFSTHAIEEQYGQGDFKTPPNRVLGNVKFPEHMVDKLEVKDYGSVRASKIKPQHIDKVVDYINNDGGSSFNSLASKFTSDHLHKLIDGNRWGEKAEGSGLSKGFGRVDSQIVSYPAFNQDHHDKLLDHYAKANYDDYPSSDNHDRNGKISQVLISSKFAKLSDIAKVGRKNVNGILDNHVIPKTEQMHVKNAIMNDVGSERDDGRLKYKVGSKGGVDVGKIPHHIGELMDKSDYSKLAEHDKVLNFGNSAHSEKMLDAHWDHVKKLDSEISNHVDKMRDEHGEGYEIHDADDYEDHHGSKLLDGFHKHMESYAKQIDNHLDHALDGDDRIHDHNAHETVGKHLENVHKLDNYKTPDNADHSDHDHYDNHFQEVKDHHENATNPEEQWDRD